mmetsp:Transcript_14482/g.41482  ORF Transcript_14482/g.41482 Transcript_14482/m.41482 type:complete len:237 (-) Transcript_14482:197-907(-)
MAHLQPGLRRVQLGLRLRVRHAGPERRELHRGGLRLEGPHLRGQDLQVRAQAPGRRGLHLQPCQRPPDHHLHRQGRRRHQGQARGQRPQGPQLRRHGEHVPGAGDHLARGHAAHGRRHLHHHVHQRHHRHAQGRDAPAHERGLHCQHGRPDDLLFAVHQLRGLALVLAFGTRLRAAELLGHDVGRRSHQHGVERLEGPARRPQRDQADLVRRRPKGVRERARRGYAEDDGQEEDDL